MKKQECLACAIISLMLDKHVPQQSIQLKEMLFKEQEILERASDLFPGTSFEHNDVHIITLSKRKDLQVFYLVAGTGEALSIYLRFILPEEFDVGEERLASILAALFGEARYSNPYQLGMSECKQFLREYYDFMRAYPFAKQQENMIISTREAPWIATATMAYNEYVRTGSVDEQSYFFEQSAIAKLAYSFNTGNSSNSIITQTRAFCTHGMNRKSTDYLVYDGDKRRLSYTGEFENTRPEMKCQLTINTIDGQKFLEDIIRFVDVVYSASIRFHLVEYKDPPRVARIEKIEVPISSYSVPGQNPQENGYQSEAETVDPSMNIDDEDSVYEEYTKEDFLSEVYMTSEEYDDLAELIKIKYNVILKGPPGVGKTFAAERLAFSLMGVKDRSRVKKIQFHQSYSYEDFIMGYRPNESGFELHKGVFYQFCKQASQDQAHEYYLIIDEINRGNLSRIFGELFVMIEKQQRGENMQLLYSDESFYVPDNLFLIGMMNTADRSLAMLDYALRRRFAFFTMNPGFPSDGFKQYASSLQSREFSSLVHCVEELNDAIRNDPVLGNGFCIGHSYFCGLKPETATKDTLSRIISYELIPLLEEYWFDEPEKIESWAGKLRRSIS